MFVRSLEGFLRLLVRWRKEPLLPVVLLLVAGSLWAFLEIGDEVGDKETHHFDERILMAMRESGDPAEPIGPEWLEESGRDLTALGGFTVLTGLTLASVGVALFLRRPRIAGIIGGAILGAMLLTGFLKNSYDRPRPDLISHGTVFTNASFPSGHSTMAAVVWLTLGLLLARTQSSRGMRIYLVVLSVAITLLVGLSRVYLGVHWPTDVLAGWALGAAWALGFWLLAIWLDKPAERGI